MSTSIDPLQPPPMEGIQQAYTAHPGHGSIGPFIGVLAVITFLGVVAIMIGRLCSGRRVFGYGQYDFEGWIETKCASCIDGRVDYSPPRMRQVQQAAESTNSSVTSASGGDVPQAEAEERQKAEAEERQKAATEEERNSTTQHDPRERTGS